MTNSGSACKRNVASGSRRTGASDAGFSLIETMIAMAILATGLLSLAGVFIMGLNHLSSSSASLIAREKAREAVESVHTARDTRVITWCQIYNVSSARGAACAAAPAGVFWMVRSLFIALGLTAWSTLRTTWPSRLKRSSIPGGTMFSVARTTCRRS